MADKNEDYDCDSDSDVSVTQLKVCRTYIKEHVPQPSLELRTQDASEKEGTCPSIQLEISANPLIELPQVADATEKKKAKKEKVAATTSKKVVTNTVFIDIEEGDVPLSVPQRMRGKTRMDKVHTRSRDKRLVIGMNEFFQPITENYKVLSELSNFLGTLAKRYVLLTYKYNKRCHFFRKRVEGREYKTNPEIINKKIKKINEKFSIVDAPDELLSDRKHGPHWLLWRCVKPSKVSSSNAPRDTYVNKLTTKIKQGVVAEVEEKVKQIQEEVDAQVNTKVQKNLASVIKKIREANPNIKIDTDIDELCVTATSDDDGTPITGGSSF
ncbi:hypothetical protein POM88_000682 [Heracleum sosnowskyi]|uniref:Uncharacterized protein n=1 Tax=Heracleum sosnowskyi TaxID=360622 RepID=A0AAD8JB53_9APIA|nr:hypothetical protein POM88_000682 [Heracleum sosnowskyi]